MGIFAARLLTTNTTWSHSDFLVLLLVLLAGVAPSASGKTFSGVTALVMSFGATPVFFGVTGAEREEPETCLRRWECMYDMRNARAVQPRHFRQSRFLRRRGEGRKRTGRPASDEDVDGVHRESAVLLFGVRGGEEDEGCFGTGADGVEDVERGVAVEGEALSVRAVKTCQRGESRLRRD